jgi:hypothetical protein
MASHERWSDKKITVLKNPQAALRSADLDTRVYAAQVLLVRYRTRDGDRPERFTAPYVDELVKTEPIDAEESRLILRTLAQADWDDLGEFATLHRVFNLLRGNGHPIDPWGWAPYQSVDHREEKAWLEKNADTYGIRRFVPSSQNNEAKKK